jgi:hypothetical protein
MPSTSALLNKPLRQRVSPFLRDAGFQHVDARNAWSWREDCIWVFNIRAVGNYFAYVTGWPPGSVCVWLGVFYTFAPRRADTKQDDLGRLRPLEVNCHMRSHLDCRLNQTARTQACRNSAERRRTAIWWVEPDGSNADEVAREIAASFVTQGGPWFAGVSDLSKALVLVEGGHDCFVKFVLASMLAKRIGDHARWQKYDALAAAVASRIGESLDRETWTIPGFSL